MTPDARVLIYDIETAPNLGYVWGKWDQDVIRFDSQWYILSFAYKWLGERRVYSVALPDFPGYKPGSMDDLGVVTALRDLFDEADITITHNGVAFDNKRARTRMLVHGLEPPSLSREIDTLRVARRVFSFTSNSLNDLCQVLGLPTKMQTGGFDTWLKCMNGDEAAWRRMVRYNKQDVRILERLYLRVRPWINDHPNVALFGDKPESCPKCGGGPLQARGWRCTALVKRRTFQCQTCKGYSQGRVTERITVKASAA